MGVPVAGSNSQPALANGILYVGGIRFAPPHQYTGTLSAVQASTAAPLWQNITGPEGSPVVADGMVFDAPTGVGLRGLVPAGG